VSSSCARNAPLDEGVNIAGILPAETKSQWSFSYEELDCLIADV